MGPRIGPFRELTDRSRSRRIRAVLDLRDPIAAPRFARQALFWFCIAFVARLLFALLLFAYSHMNGYGGYFPFESGADDEQYFAYASAYAEGRGDTLPWQSTSYPLWLGRFFMLTGPYLLAGILLNVLAGAAAVAVAVLLAGTCVEEDSPPERSWLHCAHLTGLFATLYPSSVLFSAVLMRDEFLLLAGLLATYFMMRLYRTRRAVWLVPLGISLLIFYDLRSYAAVAFAAACALFMLRQLNLVGFAIRRPVISAVLLAGSLAVIYVGVRRFAGYADPATLERLRADYAGGSSVSLALDYSSLPAFAQSYAINLAYVFVSPVPWQVTKPQHAIALLESIPLLLLFPLWIAMFVHALVKRAQPAALLLVVATFQMLPYGLLSTNAGSNARLRLIPCVLFIVFISVKYRGWLRMWGVLRRRAAVRPPPMPTTEPDMKTV